MISFKQKSVIKSYKLRLREKLKTVTEETDNATVFLNNCVEEFRKRVNHILEMKDEKWLSLYRNLIRDLENYSEKIFILQASLEEATEEESNSSEDGSSVNITKNQQQRTSSSLSSANENISADLQAEENINLQNCGEEDVNHQTYPKEILSSSEQNVNYQTYPKEILNSSEQDVSHQTLSKEILNSSEQNLNHQTYLKEISNSAGKLNLTNCHKESFDIKSNPLENSNLPCTLENNLHRYSDEKLKCSHSVVEDDGGSVTEDDFYSLHSENNINNASVDAPFITHDNQSLSVSQYASNISASQNSCYQSISSSISESLSFCKETKSIHSFKAHSLEVGQSYFPETSHFTPEIRDIELELSSNFSATLSHITDPSDFWIQMENSHGYELRFSKCEYAHLNSLSSIKKGTWCLAPFKSTSFYFRAKSLEDGNFVTDLVKVLFIDHGSYQDIPLCELKPLPESAYDIPAQAINCYLYGIASTSDSWSNEAIERFKEFQNYCIETVVKTKEFPYGVQLIAKLSADNFSEDFTVDVAQALSLDGFAILLNESYSSASHSSANNQSHLCTSQLSKPELNKTDASLEVSGSYDINAISSDSGVSVTSAYKSSQSSRLKNGAFSTTFREPISSIPAKNAPLLYDKSLNALDSDFQMQNLISFESFNSLDGNQNSNKEIKTIKKFPSQYCFLCSSNKFCLHFEIPSPTLLFVEKDMVVVMISHIVNPYEFYVNMAMENIDVLDELREQMTRTYESRKDLPHVKISNLTENMYCAGRYDADNYWYRVKVLKSVLEDGKKDEVLGQYIDYGNTAKIKCSNLKPLTQEFSKHPCFAIKCTLAGVRPIKESHWTEDAIKVFEKLTSYDRCLTAQICNELCKDDTYSVLLWDTEESKDLLINASLENRKVASFDSGLLHASSSSKTTLKPSIDTWDPMAEEYVDSLNNYNFDDEDIEIVTIGYHAKDEQYTCKYYSLRGHCPRGPNCNFKHLPLLESGITRDQEPVYCLDTTPITENINNILVQVSAIITPSTFYVILPFGSKSVDDLDSLVYRGAAYEDIINSEAKALFYALDKHYASTPFQENTTIALSCGTIVAAKRKWDEKWHRGRVVDVVDINKPAKIFFVDSGDQEWVPRKCIRTILPQFLHTPFQAVQCSLYGIEPVGSEEGLSWSSDAMNFFKEIVSEEVLLAEIVQRFGQAYQVSLRKTTRNDHRTIAQHLISSKYAQYRKVTTQKESNTRRIMYVPG